MLLSNFRASERRSFTVSAGRAFLWDHVRIDVKLCRARTGNDDRGGRRREKTRFDDGKNRDVVDRAKDASFAEEGERTSLAAVQSYINRSLSVAPFLEGTARSTPTILLENE